MRRPLIAVCGRVRWRLLSFSNVAGELVFRIVFNTRPQCHTWSQSIHAELRESALPLRTCGAKNAARRRAYTSLSGRAYWTVADFDKFDNNRLIATRFYSERR